MGCASSAPFMGEGGALGEIKEVANDLVESGENALHDMGEAAGKTIHNAVDHVKEAVSTATHGVQDAASHLGASVHHSTTAVEAEAKAAISEAKFIPLKSMSEEAEEDATKSPPESETTIGVASEGLFRPTPAPSFDKPPTPSATVLSMTDMVENPMEKIDEAIASATIEQLANDLINEAAGEAKEDRDDSECYEDEDDDLPPTKWEALADVMVELPPRMSIDLGTGQLYAVVEDDPPKSFKSYAKPAVLKGLSAETSS